MMDTKTLVVGQNLYMFSECYISEGKVVKLTPDGVEVQTSEGLLRFDKDGNELDDSRRERLGFGPSPESKFHTVLWQSAPEFQPWHIDDMPFAERKALNEKQQQEYQNHPFLAWWKSATYEERLAAIKKYYDILLPHVKSEMVPAEEVAGTNDISSNFYWTMIARGPFVEWWGKATYEQRLVVVKRYYASACYRNSDKVQVMYPPDFAGTMAESELSQYDFLAGTLAWFCDLSSANCNEGGQSG